MADVIQKVDYYYVEVPDKPGEGLRILVGLKEAGVNLLACCGFPIGEGKAQFDLVPEHEESFRRAAAELRLKLTGPKQAFLIQGGDRVGACSDTFSKLTSKGINITASQAMAAGARQWGMILWVKPADYDKASKALGL